MKSIRSIGTSLRYPGCRWYWLASTISIGSYQLGILVRALLGYEISGGDAFVASLVVASAVPGILLFSLYGGSLGDRFNKRFVTQICQLGGAVLNILLGVLFFAGLLTLPTLLGTLLIQGVFFAIQAPVRQSLIADLVPAGKLENAFSLNGLSIGLVNILAAAGGGVLYTSLGAGWAFVVVGAMLMGDAILLTRLPAASGQPAAQTGMRDSTVHNISLGLRYIWRDTKLRLIMLHAVGALLLFMPARLLLPVFALEVYGSTAVEVGWLISSLGVGGVIGSLLLARYVKNASLWIFAAGVCRQLLLHPFRYQCLVGTGNSDVHSDAAIINLSSSRRPLQITRNGGILFGLRLGTAQFAAARSGI